MINQYKLPFKWRGIIKHNTNIIVFSDSGYVKSGQYGVNCLGHIKRNLYEDSYGDYYITYHNKWEVVLQDSEGYLFITTSRRKL
jgi:hypothetical protein